MPTVVIPAYNEAERIRGVIAETLPYADELLIIDDGSSDNTADVAEQAGARVIQQPNSGYIAAVKNGFAEANGDIVVTIDADGEHAPADIPKLVEPIAADQADMVLGARQDIARPSERLISFLTRLKANVRDTGTGMRAIRTNLARKLTLPGRCICGTSVLEPLSLGSRIRERPINLRSLDKPRKIAWEHAAQLVYVLMWMLKKPPNKMLLFHSGT